MTDTLSALPDTSFKDAHPMDTVRRIHGILRSHGIETREQWVESGVPHCHSLRISIPGTPFGTNGKGVTRELALASGYGELMERLQLGYLVKTDAQKGTLVADSLSPEQVMAMDELLSQGYFAKYTALAQQATGTELTEAALLSQYADDRGAISVTVFYSAATGKAVFLPTQLRRGIYTTNGCAAGNTMEEAMVQAISEIVERHYKGRILAEKIPVPDIDEDTLRGCPIAYEIIRFLREKDFLVTVKDCSLGDKFPVVCVCLVDRRTGRYHTHFGAFPIFEIALQRTLTESFQGRNLARIGQYEDFCTDSQSLRRLMDELVRGTGEKSVDFFLNTAGVHTPSAGFSGTDNRALLKECLEFLTAQGLEVLVRDCSCLGFPTCQIIIPGYSEVFPHRLSPRHSDTRYGPVARKVLRNPATARPDEHMALLLHLSQSKAAGLSINSFLAETNLAAELSGREDGFLLHATLAHIHYGLGKTADALKAIRNAITLAEEKDAEYLICLKRYLTMKQEGQDQEKIRSVLDCFHRPDTVARLYALLEGGKNPLDPVVLHCDEQCLPECRLFSSCRKAATDQIAALVAQKQTQLDQSTLCALLKNL